MKKLLISLLLCSSLATAEIQNDKKLHFLGSTAIGAVSQTAFEHQGYSWATCMGVGLAKELTDDYIDKKDLYADALGCALGIYSIKIIQVYHDRDAVGVALNIQF